MDFDKFVKSIVNKKPINVINDTAKPIENTKSHFTPKETLSMKNSVQERREVSDEELIKGFRNTRMGLGYQELLEPTKAAQALLKIRRTAIKKVVPVVKVTKKVQQAVTLRNEKGKGRRVMDPILYLKEQRRKKAEQKALKKKG